MHQTVEMNFSEFVDDLNATFRQLYVNETEQRHQEPDESVIPFFTLDRLCVYVCVALGIPGNILSATIWLRIHVTGKNSSAVYLAALAVNDIAYLLSRLGFYAVGYVNIWLSHCERITVRTTTIIEPLLVLGFSVERLVAISCPLQVRLIVLPPNDFFAFRTINKLIGADPGFTKRGSK